MVGASARASASGLVPPVRSDPRLYPPLSWRWRVDDLVPGAGNTRKRTGDSPVSPTCTPRASG
ncbi:MAG: DUF3047 domain-containing protein [Burkholderiales bacterium]|nr:DUF3047 domain-containing protein [Burkholderiales bacterium]